MEGPVIPERLSQDHVFQHMVTRENGRIHVTECMPGTYVAYVYEMRPGREPFWTMHRKELPLPALIAEHHVPERVRRMCDYAKSW